MKKIFTKKQLKKIKESLLDFLVLFMCTAVPAFAMLAHWIIFGY